MINDDKAANVYLEVEYMQLRLGSCTEKVQSRL